MKPALAIFVRATTADELDDDLRRVEQELVVKPSNRDFRRLFVVGAGADPARPSPVQKKMNAWAKRFFADVFDPSELEAFVPKQLRDKDIGCRQLSEYLAQTLVDRIVSRADAEGLALLWRADWSDLLIAGAGVVATTNEVGWWRADSQQPWPTIPTGFRYRDLWRPTPHLGQDTPILGRSAAVKELLDQLRRCARFPAPVLLVGETGTGKELCAKALHDQSERRGRFVPVNCALLGNDSAAESTLFGHIKGAYTGAQTDRTGRMREAHNGTLFLDEMMDMPVGVQARLLRATNRVEQARLHVVPMGGSDSDRHEVDVRVVSAIQPDGLQRDVLRRDLYHRLAWHRIEVPALRHREDDAVLIAKAHLAALNQALLGKSSKNGAVAMPIELTTDAAEALSDPHFYEWPGNVRELQTVIYRAWHDAATSNDAPEISRAVITKCIDRTLPALAPSDDLRRTVAQYVVDAGEAAVAKYGTKTRAARHLGWTDKNAGQTFWDWVGKHRRFLREKAEK